MKAVQWSSAIKGLRFVDDAPVPSVPSPDHVLVRVAYASVCGSDLHNIKGEWEHPPDGRIMGHELSGKIIYSVFLHNLRWFRCERHNLFPLFFEKLEFILLSFFAIPIPSASLQVRVSAGSSLVGSPGHYINVQRCRGLSMVFLQLRAPLELFVKGREFLPGSEFDLTEVPECDVKTHAILPSILLPSPEVTFVRQN